MFNRYVISYDFNLSSAAAAPDSLSVVRAVENTAAALRQEGMTCQLAGGLVIDESAKSFSINCTDNFAQKLGTTPGMVALQKVAR